MISLVPEEATPTNLSTLLPPDESYEQHRGQHRGAGEDGFVHAASLNARVAMAPTSACDQHDLGLGAEYQRLRATALASPHTRACK